MGNAFCGGIQRLKQWIWGVIPIDWLVRRAVRWLAFGASKEQLAYILMLCEGVAPIAQSALQAARLREVYERACDEGACTPALQDDVDKVRSFLESATQQALDATFTAMDADGDGRVTLAEALSTWEAVVEEGQRDGERTAAVAMPAATLLEAMRRAQTVIEEMERLKYGVSLAVEGAVAAVDADGDGKVSFDEAMQAPGRIASWMGVWRELIARGKV